MRYFNLSKSHIIQSVFLLLYSPLTSSYCANFKNTCSSVVWLKLYSSISNSVLAEKKFFLKILGKFQVIVLPSL